MNIRRSLESSSAYEKDHFGRFRTDPPIFNFLKWIGHLFWAFFTLVVIFYILSEFWIGVIAMMGTLALILITVHDQRIVAFAWFIGIPTLFVFPNSYFSTIPFFTVERALFFGLTGYLLLEIAFAQHKQVKVNSLDALILIFLAILIASWIAHGASPNFKKLQQDIAFFVQGYATPQGCFVILRRMDWRQKHLNTFLWALAMAGVFLALVGVMQVLFGLDWFTAKHYEVIHEERANGVFSNAGEYGSVVACMCITTLFLLLKTHDTLLKAVLVVSVLLMIVGLLFSETRASWLAFVVGMGFVAVFHPKSRMLLMTGALIAVLLGAVLMPFVVDSDIWHMRIVRMDPIYNRLALWATSARMILDNPAFGVGFARDSFVVSRLDYWAPFGNISAQWAAEVGLPHNEFLHIAILTGVGGLIIFVCIIWRLFHLFAQIKERFARNLEFQFFHVYLAATVVVYLVNAFFLETGLFNYLGMFMFGLAAIAARVSEIDAETHHS